MSVRIPEQVRRAAPYAVAVAFSVSGVIHLVRPGVFTPLVPRALPAPTFLVYASGVAELGCAGGLFAHRTWAGPAAALLLVAVLPGNVQMALDAGTGRHPGLLDNAALAWARVPLQLPLIWGALQARPMLQWRGPRRGRAAA